MEHQDHVRLIAPGIDAGSGGVWADMGAGVGAFTLALRDVVGPDIELYAVDFYPRDLQRLLKEMMRHFPDTNLHLLDADFRRKMELPQLDGILSANAIHYVPDKVKLLGGWRQYLKPRGRLIIVEYDADEGNQWVPYPISYANFGDVVEAAGFSKPSLLGVHDSRFLNGMYAAGMSRREESQS
jgi:ubiquinone/menaquinone biosynthesis C-methylase UbiE